MLFCLCSLLLAFHSPFVVTVFLLHVFVYNSSWLKSKDLREHNGRENSKKYTLKTIEILILWDIMKKSEILLSKSKKTRSFTMSVPHVLFSDIESQLKNCIQKQHWIFSIHLQHLLLLSAFWCKLFSHWEQRTVFKILCCSRILTCINCSATDLLTFVSVYVCTQGKDRCRHTYSALCWKEQQFCKRKSMTQILSSNGAGVPRNKADSEE